MSVLTKAHAFQLAKALSVRSVVTISNYYLFPISPSDPISEQNEKVISSSALKNRDVALFRGTDTLVDDSKKKQLIEDGFWQPGIEYKFSQSSKDDISFQSNWLNRFKWLVYSEKDEGAYCKFCVVFAPDLNVQQTFISKPHNKYRTAIEEYLKHQNSKIHQNTVHGCSHFLNCRNKKLTSVINSVNDQCAKEVSKNRAILASIMKTVIFCARQEIALRGHRDSGILKEDSKENEGNFRAALCFRIDAGDEI
ncbi:hypothetical protein AVEN_235918-1 [Araneus ventricosus]|uniref:TTF-type domain-containing protein n=1 Tax=Araneus ventricosus TaxID=182803 RepID=A0A4Y2RFE7_ARAVE|nr:hypothetical protein AVEN_235918-1 [Araneus ventricosus]